MQAPVIHGRAATHSTSSAADSGPATPLARLLLISEGHTVSDRPLYRGRVIIGRAPDAELHVDSRLISRYHCQVISNDRMSVIEDLNSTNGIYIKDKRLRRHNLHDGDVITLGSHQLMYIDERPGHRPHTADSGAETGEFEVTVVSGEATQG
jgi:pSer/pThr/pTyr-binding forkhead associated (FHA) protein